MELAVLLVFENAYVSDRDMLMLLSTCKSLNALKYRVEFSEYYDYFRVWMVPYLDQITNVILKTHEPPERFIFMDNVKHLHFYGDVLNYIPKNVTMLATRARCRINCSVLDIMRFILNDTGRLMYSL